MKKIIGILFVLLLVCSCASIDARVSQLEDKVARLEKRSVVTEAEAAGAAQNFHWRTGLEGGSGKLDGITGMADGDGAIIAIKSGTTTTIYFYIYKDPDTSIESSPMIIQPVSGTGRWFLCGVQAATITSNSSTGNYISVTNSGNPSSPVEGWIWYDLNSHKIEYRDNLGVKQITGVQSEP